MGQGQSGLQGEPGPRGLQGETGPRGLQGETGPRGLQGETGPRGLKGETGPPGTDGINGEKGETGNDGADGADGEKGDSADDIDLMLASIPHHPHISGGNCGDWRNFTWQNENGWDTTKVYDCDNAVRMACKTHCESKGYTNYFAVNLKSLPGGDGNCGCVKNSYPCFDPREFFMNKSVLTYHNSDITHGKCPIDA